MTTTLPLSLAQRLKSAQNYLAAGQGDKAVEIMKATSHDFPNNAVVSTGLGVAYRFKGDIFQAEIAFLKALALEPGKPDAQVYLGMIRLAQGQQEEGWQLYQARWRNSNWVEKLRYPQESLWQGEIKPGLRLLLWSEQGFGDTIQFARYAPWLLRLLVKNRARLVLEVPRPLHSLFCATWPFMDIVCHGEAQGHFDAHLPLMNLPACWGNKVGNGGLPYLPMPGPYLSALPDTYAQARAVPALTSQTQTFRQLLRVGITWQGRPTHPDDHFRSIEIKKLQALFEVPGICWVSLQKDTANHPTWLPESLIHCQNFSATARVVNSLDLIISIDSAVAHLAGALGRPVWLLLPKLADWRWGLHGENTPWYPTMRLFRQESSEGWLELASRVALALTVRTEQQELLNP